MDMIKQKSEEIKKPLKRNRLMKIMLDKSSIVFNKVKIKIKVKIKTFIKVGIKLEKMLNQLMLLRTIRNKNVIIIS